MNSRTTIPLSEFRKNLFKIADRVRRPGTYYTLTEKGRPTAVLMSVEEFESCQETLEVMQDFPDLGKRIQNFKKDLKSGAYLKYKPLEDFLIESGYIIRDGKPKFRYGVSNTPRKARGKRPAKNS